MPNLPPPAPALTGSAGAGGAAALLPCRSCGRVYPAEQLLCPTDGMVLPLEGRLLDSKFRLDRKVGDGGMASVWQATNTFVHRTVAIKLMHARYASDAELLGRFRNEASAAGRIGSPHICDVLDFGQSEIGPYIVLELLEGCSLAELISTHRRLDPGLAVWIVRQALAGLEAAHRVGIVHRDLKPENIFLCRAIRGQWVVKLMDFGISKFALQVQTAAGATMGTPHYMAPEQIHGSAGVDARADLWSIGAILYEALTSVQLFARDNVAEALGALRTLEIPPVKHYAPEVAQGLGEIVARCLQRPPERRFQSAQALSEALAPFEHAGERMSLAPVGPDSPNRAADTVHRASAQPRALAQPAQRKPEGRAPALPAPARAPSGVHPPVGAQAMGPRPVPRDMKRTGPQAPVGEVPRTGPQAPVKRTGPQATVKPTGPQATLKSAAVGRPVTGKQTGPQAVVAARPVSQRAVPRDMQGGAPRAAAQPRAARPPTRKPTIPPAWLWGLLLAGLGGGVVLLAVLLN